MHDKSKSVSSIHVEYSDGSYDDIELLQDGDDPQYGLDRTQSNAEQISLGLHSGGAIACLLFISVVSNCRTEYDSMDPRIGALFQAWLDASAAYHSSNTIN